MQKKAVFLDRDGIIVKPIQEEAPQKVQDLKLIPQIIPIIKKLKDLGYLIIVVSNQPDIAMRKITEKTRLNLENKFTRLLEEKTINIDAIYYCHHHPESTIEKYAKNCDCRKPKPGMLLKAAKKFNIDLCTSFLVGDRASDIKAGDLAGVETILFDPKNLQKKYLVENIVKPNIKIKSLPEILSYVESKTLDAIILAAGIGNRMQPLTTKTPKPLLRINGMPMMEYVVRLLKKNGFKNIGINLFYLGDKIKKCFADGSKWKVNIKYIEEKSLSGSAGGIRAILKKIKPNNSIIVISSDMMVNFDLRKIFRFHQKNNALVTICCYFRNSKQLIPSKSGLLVFDKKTKKVLNFSERPKTKAEIKSNWVNSSVYVFNPEILKFIPKKKVVEIARDVIPILLQKKLAVYAFPINRKKYYQLGIDTPDRVKKIEDDIKSGEFSAA